jgi:hypothetical protein
MSGPPLTRRRPDSEVEGCSDGPGDVGVGGEQRDRELIVDFQWPIMYLYRAAAVAQTLDDLVLCSKVQC